MDSKTVVEKRHRRGLEFKSHRERRKNKAGTKLSQEELAKSLGGGISQRHISNYELGRRAKSAVGPFAILEAHLNKWNEGYVPEIQNSATADDPLKEDDETHGAAGQDFWHKEGAILVELAEILMDRGVSKERKRNVFNKVIREKFGLVDATTPENSTE